MATQQHKIYTNISTIVRVFAYFEICKETTLKTQFCHLPNHNNYEVLFITKGYRNGWVGWSLGSRGGAVGTKKHDNLFVSKIYV